MAGTAFFYAIDARACSRLIERVRTICRTDDRAAWAALYEKLARIPVHLTITGPSGLYMSAEPLTGVAYNAGRPALDPVAPPAADAPSLTWVLSELVFITAPLTRIAGSGLNGCFTDGWNIESTYTSDAQREAFAWLRDRLFNAPRELPAPFDVLVHPDASYALLTHEDLGTFLEIEARAGLLTSVARDLAAGEFPGHGANIMAMKHFFELAHVSRLSLYYREMFS